VVAAGTATAVVTTDLGADDRWPLDASIGPDAHRAVLSTGFALPDGSPGALTLYAEPGRSFDRGAVVTTSVLATQAVMAIGRIVDRLEHQAQTEAWERALASRDQIGQAKGILMATHDLSAEAAFALLRATSQAQNTKLRDVADHVVATRALPDPPPGATADRPSG
jgi:hypothetical protein